jgi:FKBP-type peptidyl-prolyl cis-trans isomerase 2
MAVKKGDKIQVHYKGTLVETGMEFDNSYERGETLNFEVGLGQMIKGFEDAVYDMEIGQIKEIQIPASEAYGDHMEAAIQNVPRSNFPPDFEVNIGSMVQGQNQMGHPIQALVVEENEQGIVLDFNHPLAGKDLNFSIELVGIE